MSGFPPGHRLLHGGQGHVHQGNPTRHGAVVDRPHHIEAVTADDEHAADRGHLGVDHHLVRSGDRAARRHRRVAQAVALEAEEVDGNG